MRIARTLAAALVLALLAGAAEGQTIHRIGLMRGYPSIASKAEAINADGSVVVGTNLITGNTNLAVRWSVTGGLEDLSCGGASLLTAISGTGDTAAGSVYDGSIFRAAKWDSPSTCVAQMSQPATAPGRASGMTPSGSLIVGSSDYFNIFSGSYSLPWKWTQSSGVTMLPLSSGYGSGTPRAVSSDGQIIVGNSGVQSVIGANSILTYWDSTGHHPIGNMPAGITSYGMDTNSDGSVIVGYGDNGGAVFVSPGPSHAFRWTAGGGFEDLGLLAGAIPGHQSFGRAVTEDGTVVLGEGNIPAGLTAFIWRQDFGMVPLMDFLGWAGVDLTGWSALTECHGVSSDSTAVCGTGIYNGTTYGFVVRGLPQICGPIVLAQTGDQTVCAGDTAIISVAALTPGHARYQWSRILGEYPFYYIEEVSDGGGISGATTSILIFNPASSGHSGQYFCTISGGCATVSTPIVNFTVLSQPVVTLNPPLSLLPCGKGPESITVAATSNAGPISYQWQAETPFMSGIYVDLVNGLNTGVATAAGVTTPTLTLTDFYLGGSTIYRCRLVNSCGTSFPYSTLVYPCFGDFNCDGDVDFFDYLDYVDSYSASGPEADFNKDGVVDFFDYLDFADSYSAGC